MSTLIPIEHVERDRRGLLVRRGLRLGEASPLPGRSAETVDDVVRALMLGGDAPASLDFALWTLDATTTTAPITSQVLLEDPKLAVTTARRALALGARAFKLKIRSQTDAEVLGELRALARDAILRVDANRAFARECDVPWDALARAGVEWIEEPCPDAGALVGTPVPIALDESVAGAPDEALDHVAGERVAALVLKPTVLGARETLRLGRACLAHGGRVIVSHAFESDVGRCAAEELARRLAPSETHGVHRWDGIDAFRLRVGGMSVRRLSETGGERVDSALG